MSAIRKEELSFDYGQEYGEYSPKKRRIKKKKKNNNVIENFKNTLMIAVTFILGISIVYNYAVITDKQMELNNINQDIAALKDEIDTYNITLESIKNTNSIEETAKSYLGMNYPTRKQTVFVDFTYGDTETEQQTANSEDENKNILVGIIDKVVSFIH